MVEACLINSRLIMLSILFANMLSDTAVFLFCGVVLHSASASLPSSYRPLGTQLSLNKLDLLLVVGREHAYGKLWGISVGVFKRIYYRIWAYIRKRVFALDGILLGCGLILWIS